MPSSVVERCSLRSAPEEKPRPAPVIIRARTESSPATVVTASRRSRPNCSFHAFSASGRLRRMRAAESSLVKSTVSWEATVEPYSPARLWTQRTTRWSAEHVGLVAPVLHQLEQALGVLRPASLDHQLDPGLADREADALANVVHVDQVGAPVPEAGEQGGEGARLVGDLGEDPQSPAALRFVMPGEVSQHAGVDVAA